VRRVKKASSESFTSGPDEPKINWATGGVSLTDSKLWDLTERKTGNYLICFLSIFLFRASIMFRFQICFHHCI
jgi:hypothetical protein